jgi:divalent metal cation (Fe/Co/Zn/Cd) transporter
LNGIVLVGAINQYQTEYSDIKEAIRKACAERLRPIMMTALVASLVIAANAVAMLRPAVHDLMDRAPEPDVRDRILAAAQSVPEVRALEKLKVRRVGAALFVDLHVQADPALSLHDAHIVSGCVKTAIRRAVPVTAGVLIHMEPFEPSSS